MTRTMAIRRVPPSCCIAMLGIRPDCCARAWFKVRGRSGVELFFSGDVSSFASFVSPGSSVGFGWAGCACF